MFVGRLLLISLLLVVSARCDCDKYFECFGEFLRDFFKNLSADDKVKTNHDRKTEVIDLSEHGIGIDGVLSDITSLIENIDLNIKQADIVKHEHNNTKIVVKTFDLHDDVKQETATQISTTTPLQKEQEITSTNAKETLVTTITPKETTLTTTTAKHTEVTTTTPKDFEVTYTTPIESEETTTEFNILEELIFADHSKPERTTTINSFSVIPLKSDKDNEIDAIDSEYGPIDENFTDYPNIDYIEIYKDTTNEPVMYVPTEPPTNTEYYSELRAEIDRQENEIENIIEYSVSMLNDVALTSILENVTNHNFHRKQPTLSSFVFPWVAAIFLKNDSKGSQFDYFCDGAIINDRAILTAARCVRNGNDTYNEESFIVILGKTSLQVSGGDERILRVKSVRVHENFDENGDAENDLAVLVLEEPIIFNGAISPANWTDGETHEEDGDASEALTTAWSLRGDLTLIYFDKAKSKVCGTDNKVKNTLCATYGDAVALCPSYGGLYVTKRTDKLYLNGIRTGNPLQRGICFSKEVSYTSLHNYTEWIRDTVENKYV